MIRGLGVDMIEIARIEKANENIRWRKKLFSEREEEIFFGKNFAVESIAGRFAAKEACLKALGLSLSIRRMKEIEVVNDQQGKPKVFLYGECAAKATGGKIHVSITHEKQHALAMIIWEE